MLLSSTNIKCIECLKSQLRSNITASNKLMAIDVVDKASNCKVLINQLTITLS